MIKATKEALTRLKQHQSENENRQIGGLFESDPVRFDAFSVKCGEVLFDYAKNNISGETLDLLQNLLQERMPGLEATVSY